MKVIIDLNKCEDQFYTGHCIDGKIILPGAGYLMLAWVQLAATLGKTWQNVPVVFENVQYRRSVSLSKNKKTFLEVNYDQHSGNFFILENDKICALGKIRCQTEDTLLVQNIIHEKQNTILENEFSLGPEDINRELRIMGYEYSGEFVTLKKIRTNDFLNFHGLCKWTGNMVTFLDGITQASAFAISDRKLMIPIMVRSVRIDPKVLFESALHYKLVENNAGPDKQDEIINMVGEEGNSEIVGEFPSFEAEIPVYHNSNTRLLVTHGVEIEDLLAIPFRRKVDMTDLVLNSYEFVLNEDNCAIDECDGNNIIEYLEVCKSMAAQLKRMGIKNIKCDFNHKYISEEMFEKFKQKYNENHIIFKILHKIYEFFLVQNNSQQIIEDLRKSKDFDLEKDCVNTVSKNERLIRGLTDIVSENIVPKRVLKVTEINLSSDLFVKEVERYLSGFMLTPIDYQLIVRSTEDLSEKFRAKARVWDTKEELKLKSSDLIILRDNKLLHEINLDSLLEKVTSSIVENGFLMIVTRFRLTEPELVLNSLLNDKNIDLGKRVLEIIKTSEELGLNIICKKSDNLGTIGLLFRKVQKKEIPKNNQIIEITAERNEKWFDLIKDKLIDGRKEDNKRDNIWLIARDSKINGILGLINCLRLEPGGECMRCIFDFDHKITLPIDWNSKPFSDILRNDLVINVIKDGKLGTYRHLSLPKDCDQIVSNEYFLSLGQTKGLSSLQWFDSRKIVANKEYYGINNERVTQIPVKIYSTGLNYQDVMFATGRISYCPQLLYTDCLIGTEFVGRRADTGERVMGFELSRTFATSIDANEDFISPIPEHWSMLEANTLLTPFFTAWYGLINRANLKKSESILIHSGAGGVGQSAINVCKHYECDIFVTVGTEEKKLFLINEYNIPENRIFSSRDIQFKYRIMELTKGKGVDLVLNTLAGEKLDASYQCLADGGRFVQLGKHDLVQNKQLGMFDFIRDISFIGVSIDNCMMKRSEFVSWFFKWLNENSNNGCVKPLTKIVFNANEVEKAFRHMTTGKHIGRIVIKIRDEESIKTPNKSFAPTLEMLTTRKTYFDPNKVYIITGGLSGFGLELVQWMSSIGAKKFVLTSRSGLKTDYQKFIINRLIITGNELKYFKVDIKITQNDCITPESTQRVISDASQMGEIGGIFHLSLVFDECLVENLIFDKFWETIDRNYKTFSNLEVESRKLGYNLDYFVFLFSVAGAEGNAGQAYYAFGNSLCERLCEQRRKEGLHGLALQYGPVADVGLFEGRDQLSTLQKQKINSCFDVLDKILSIKQSLVTSWVATP